MAMCCDKPCDMSHSPDSCIPLVSYYIIWARLGTICATLSHTKRRLRPPAVTDILHLFAIIRQEVLCCSPPRLSPCLWPRKLPILISCF